MACTEQERDQGSSTLRMSLKFVRQALSFGEGGWADILVAERFFILSRKRLSWTLSGTRSVSASRRKPEGYDTKIRLQWYDNTIRLSQSAASA